jgi:hypothetical protein
VESFYHRSRQGISHEQISLGSGGGGISTISRGGGGFISGVLVGGVDSNLDSDGASTNLLALQSSDGLLLLCLAANIDESVTLALPGLSPAPANDAGANDVDTSLSEEGGKTSIVNIETKVGDEKHGSGRFTGGILTRGTGWTRGLGLAHTRFLGGALGSGFSLSSWSSSGLLGSGTVSTSGGGSLLSFALKEKITSAS